MLHHTVAKFYVSRCPLRCFTWGRVVVLQWRAITSTQRLCLPWCRYSVNGEKISERTNIVFSIACAVASGVVGIVPIKRVAPLH